MLAEKPWKLDAVVRLFLGVMATVCLGGALAGFLGSSKFTVEEIKDASGLVKQLARQTNQVSSFLWRQFSTPEQLRLWKYEPSAASSKEVPEVVVRELNNLIEGPCLYDRARFQGVSLRSETINLLKENPTGQSLAHLNRLLLEDAYPSELSRSQSAFWLLVISACCLEIPALVGIALFLRHYNVSWKAAFGFQSLEPVTAVAYGVLAGALFVPAGWLLETLSGYLMDLVHSTVQDQQIVQTLQDPSLTLPKKIIMGMIAVILAPVVEELLFRGLLYPAIKQQGRPRLALWLTSVLFALVHFNMETFVPLLVFALVLVYLYETFQNLLAPIVAHSLFNAANFLTLIFQDKIAHWLHST